MLLALGWSGGGSRSRGWDDGGDWWDGSSVAGECRVDHLGRGTVQCARDLLLAHALLGVEPDNLSRDLGRHTHGVADVALARNADWGANCSCVVHVVGVDAMLFCHRHGSRNVTYFGQRSH